MSLKQLRSKKQPLIMGIVNVTDDSFSGDGLGENKEAIISRVESHLEGGADLLDIGAVSTRPGSDPIPEATELKRITLALEIIKSRWPSALLSVDTSSPMVMAASIEMGVHMINDVYAFRKDGALEVLRGSQVDLLMMHMQGVPKTMQNKPNYGDVVQEVSDFLVERIDLLEKAGIDRDRVWIDPGFGFGKTMAHNYTLLRNLQQFSDVSSQICAGLSRKKMIAQAIGSESRSRVVGTVSANLLAVLNGARMLRVHDVQEAKDAVSVLYAYENMGLIDV